MCYIIVCESWNFWVKERDRLDKVREVTKISTTGITQKRELRTLEEFSEGGGDLVRTLFSLRKTQLKLSY